MSVALPGWSCVSGVQLPASTGVARPPDPTPVTTPTQKSPAPTADADPLSNAAWSVFAGLAPVDGVPSSGVVVAAPDTSQTIIRRPAAMLDVPTTCVWPPLMFAAEYTDKLMLAMGFVEVTLASWWNVSLPPVSVGAFGVALPPSTENATSSRLPAVVAAPSVTVSVETPELVASANWTRATTASSSPLGRH